MSPKVACPKRGEPPKPVIRRDTLGFFPLNAFALSCLEQSHGDVIIGFRDTPGTVALKAAPRVKLEDGGQKRMLDLEGRFFNGLGDALYRGRLPEVLVVSPTEEEMPDFLEDLAEYLEQQLSLGFFLPKKEILKRDPVADLIPCTVLTGQGILFSRFITGLLRYLRQFESQHPVMNEALRLRIVARFVRGLPMGTDCLPGMPSVAAGSIVPRVEIPACLRIAGGNRHTLETIQGVLGSHGLVASIENRVRNPVERLEFEHALVRLATVILPALAERKMISAGELKGLLPRLEQGILSIGRSRQAFDESDPPILTEKSPQRKPRKATVSLSVEDAAILHGLRLYAEALGLKEEQAMFSQLAVQVAGCCRQSD